MLIRSQHLITDPGSGDPWQCPRELPDLRRVDLISLDSETNDAGLRADRGSSWPWGDGYVCGISVAWHEGGVIARSYIPMRHPDSENFDPAQVYRWLKDHIAAGMRFVTLNGIYDWGWLRTDGGIVMPPSDQLEEVGALATIVDENQRRYSLDALCERYGLPGKDETLLLEGVKALGLAGKARKKLNARELIYQLPARYVGPYAEGDAVNTLLLYEKHTPVLDKEGTRGAYRLEVNLMPMVLEMRRRGVRVDPDRAEQSRDLLLSKRDAALAELSEQHGALIGMDEINSAKWKEKAFEQYGLRTPHRTATGKMSFAKGGGKDGWMIAHEHWLPRLISTAGKYDGAANKFLQGHILDHIVQGRIYAELHPFKTEDSGTRSFRFSYSEPPLQQIPKRDPEIMPLIRDCFQAEEGEVWATADANQQEFRIFVHEGVRHGLPGAHEAAELYRNSPDADFHKMVEELVQTDRTAAKGINFGNIYGAGLAKLAEMMRKTPEEAAPIIAEYNRRLPFVKKLSQLCRNEAERTGYTEMPNGGRRHWDQYEVAFSNGKDAGPCSLEEARLRAADPAHPWHRKQLSRYGTYKALNALIQGSAAIHTKNWMLACWREGIVPRLQVHDALECSVATREQAELVARLGAAAVKLEVPMLIDLKFGRNWGDATHSWEELRGEPERNGGTYSCAKTSITLLAEDTTPASAPPLEAVMATDSSDLEPAEALSFPDGDAIAEADSNESAPSPTPPEPPSTAIDKHRIWVTVFPNEFASSLKHGAFTLPQIVNHIRMTTAASKGELPWIKLQRFGDKATARNCLRNDANVLEIHGLEGEHDKGTMTLDDAVARLSRAGIRCILYTSPSYVPGAKERWRVLVPLSRALAPSLRVGLLARLNGILDGCLAPESFTLSQAYYYGSVDNNPNHKCGMLDGDFIDLRDDLIAGAIFKDGSKAGGKLALAAGSSQGAAPSQSAPLSQNAPSVPEKRKPSAPWEDPIIGILTDERLHDSIRDLAAKLVAAGTDPAAVENILRGLMEKSQAKRDERWQDRYDDIPRAVASAVEKYAPSPPVDLSALAAHLKGLGGPTPALALTPPGRGAGGASSGASSGASGGASSGGGTASTPPLIEARPFVLRDPTTLTKRQWVYGTHLIRKFGSATFAPSGSGKSTLMIVEALAIATGRPLLGITPPRRARVWYWNGEDPFDELERRVAAACLHYGIDAAEIDGWLFINSGRDPNSAVVIATQDRNGTTIAIPVVDALVATIRAKGIDVVMIDPFISSHRVPENDNNAIDEVAKTWTMIADVTDTAIDLAHHTRKTYGAEVTVEDSRGASALLNAVRPARVINAMTEDEALKGGVADGRKRYFKVTDGKNNLALPLDKLDWFRSESVFLGNGDPGDSSDKGDNVGVVTVWEWPDAMAGVSDADIEKVKEAIRAGKWRKDPRAKEWVGHAVAKALGLGDVRNKGLDRTRVTTLLINTWIYKEVLKVVTEKDAHYEDKEFVEVA